MKLRAANLALFSFLLAACGTAPSSSESSSSPVTAGTSSQSLQPTASSATSFIYGWCGNTDESATTLTATTNFAVMTNHGGSGDRFGTGLPNFDAAFAPGLSSQPLDTTARYLYIYQDVSDTVSTDNLGEVWTQIPGVSIEEITSWGSFSDAGFQDVKGQTDAANPFGWPNPQAPYVAHLGVTDPSVISIAGGTDPGVNPTVVYIGDFDNSAYITFRRAWVGPTGLEPGRRGVIVGYTSNYPPRISRNGANPEPVSIPQALVVAAAPVSTPPTILVTEGSADARGVLSLLNIVTGTYLADTVGITPISAQNIERAGTLDSMAQVRSLTTGPDFDLLVTFARANGYVQ